MKPATAEAMDMAKEFEGEDPTECKVPSNAFDHMESKKLFKKAIELSKRKKELEDEMDHVKAELDDVKRRIQEIFLQMGVSSVKAEGRTLYTHRSIFAGAAEGATNLQISKALESLSLENYVTFNHQSLSAYVRETAKEHPGYVDENGNIIATPEQILAALPKPLNTLLKVSEKFDIKIRK